LENVFELAGLTKSLALVKEHLTQYSVFKTGMVSETNKLADACKISVTLTDNITMYLLELGS